MLLSILFETTIAIYITKVFYVEYKPVIETGRNKLGTTIGTTDLSKEQIQCRLRLGTRNDRLVP